jgi:hypothetical protein
VYSLIRVSLYEDRIAELISLTEDRGPTLPRFSLQRHATSDLTGKVHVEQLGFMRDRSHRVHTMCARQAGKSQADFGILLDAGLFQPYSTNLILGLNGPHLRMNAWEPIWKRMFAKYGGLDPDWNYERMESRFPNGARVIFFGADDSKHLKNILGGRIENGVVIVDEAQELQGLDELMDDTLPPMMGMNARLILTGVFPEVPAGRFWRESGWVERGGQWVQEQTRGWSRHNWGRLANIHVADSWEILQRYLRDTGKSMGDPDIIRDWLGKPAFDPNVTAYRYNAARNGYKPVEPDWLRMVYAAQKDERGRPIKYCHPMRPDKDGVLNGMMASAPSHGVKIFALALDPGHASDRASIQGIGWGDGFRGTQHLFDWTTERKSFVSTGDMFAVLGMAYRAFLRWGEALNPHYDAGSSTNTIDNLQGDYGLPLVLAAKKSDKKGQVDRVNDMLTETKATIMFGSAVEQDFTRARWNKNALEHHVYDWDRAHHPDASEAFRYATGDYFDATVPKTNGKDAPAYGYQDSIDKAKPTVNYNPAPATEEAYGGGNIYPQGRGDGGGGYGGPWGTQ